ncbi:MAG: M28 family peptidase [Flavobacteriaceae bacterium]|nr:M28 family peptidase [Flavobacteriaceae bacterium]
MLKQLIVYSLWLLVYSSGLFISGCKSVKDESDNSPTAPIDPAPKQVLASPDFNADSAYKFVKRQVAFGNRVPGTAAHKECAEWLFAKLKQYTPNVSFNGGKTKTFDGKTHTVKNVVAEFNLEAKKRVLLCAHWDTRPFADQDVTARDKPIEGANDGGSGVGILLEIARVMKEKAPTIGVDIILFDIEDYGQPQESKYTLMEDSYCLGSQYWGKNPHKKGYKADWGILLDMVGGTNARFTMEGNSLDQAGDATRKVWDIAAQLGIPNFIATRGPDITDDHYYIFQLTDIPVLDIIEYDAASPSRTFSRSWHTHQDVLANISTQTLKAVGQTVAEAVYREK